jgi:hypothetical protein
MSGKREQRSGNRDQEAGVRPCRANERITIEARRTQRRKTLLVIPAKTGIHFAEARVTDRWVPAFAGTTIFSVIAVRL